MNVIIIGSGAVAAELTSYIEDQNKHVAAEKQINLKGYLDSKENIEKYWTKYKFKKPVLADIHSYDIQENDYFIIGISDISFRSKLIKVLENKNAKITGLIHYSAMINESAVIGKGTIIYPHCIIGPNCTIGEYNMITSYSFISHDCTVGNSNFFSTTGLAGNVTVGHNNYFGIRSTIIPHVVIGSNNIIQAGMVIDKDVENNETVFYKYKEKIIAIPKI